MLLLALGSMSGHADFDGGQGLGVHALTFVLRDDEGRVEAVVGCTGVEGSNQ